ncbi:MAG: molybdopterin molybdotransferase MoeA [Deltaproteobacteria bacterium]|nr:molybdopterin molybdotransferase MoeA [Deltaproteobacteria bacterium]
MNIFEPMLPCEKAFELLDNALAGYQLPGKSVTVAQAYGRVLLNDQTSLLELPPFNKSAMDGYAIRADDRQDQYRVVETVAAGQVSRKTIEPGTAVRIMTGACVPPGGGRVIKVEDTQQDGDLIKVLSFEDRTNIAEKAQDVRIGDLILSAGTRLGSLEIANLVSCGITQLEVVRRPQIAVLSTGDEIVDSPDQLGPGKIMNSNGPMLAGLAHESGLKLISQDRVPDTWDATVAAIENAMDQANLVVLSGGVSVGEYDFVLKAMSAAGLTVHFSRVAILPGKPTVFASREDTFVFGLPGNPVSVFIMFHLFVRRAVALLSGSTPGLRDFPVRLAADFKRRKIERLQHVPCRINQAGECEPVDYHGSAHLAAIMRADGFFLVAVGTAELKAGQQVTFIPMAGGFK